MAAFGTRGYEGTSLDDLARSSASASRRSSTGSPPRRRCSRRWSTAAPTRSPGAWSGAGGADDGFGRVEAMVRAMFRLAARHPAMLGFLREVTRLGPPRRPACSTASSRSSTGRRLPGGRDGRRPHAPPRPPPAAAGRLLDGHRPGHRGGGAALRRGAHLASLSAAELISCCEPPGAGAPGTRRCGGSSRTPAVRGRRQARRDDRAPLLRRGSLVLRQRLHARGAAREPERSTPVRIALLPPMRQLAAPVDSPLPARRRSPPGVVSMVSVP